jgi:hypothetical protein
VDTLSEVPETHDHSEPHRLNSTSECVILPDMKEEHTIDVIEETAYSSIAGVVYCLRMMRFSALRHRLQNRYDQWRVIQVTDFFPLNAGLTHSNIAIFNCFQLSASSTKYLPTRASSRDRLRL